MIQSIRQGTIGSRLAVPALLLLPLSVLAHRFGLFSFQLTTAFIALGLLISLAILICSVIAYIRNNDPQFRSNVKTTMLISAVMPAIFVAVIISIASSSGGNVPLIHDITTDTVNVPQFQAGIVERGSDSNSLAVEPDVIKEQIKGYPDLKSLVSPLDTDAAFQRANDIAKALGWEIYNSDKDSGIIEASDTTLIWGFVDDVVIRIQASETGSLIDLRSVSRVGQGDIGANAKRIKKFIARFNAE